VHFTAFSLGGPFFPDTSVAHQRNVELCDIECFDTSD